MIDKSKLGEKLIHAVLIADLQGIRYLLTSPELKEHADINYKNFIGNTPLIIACAYSNLEIVKYLLTSPELKEHAQINQKNDDDSTALISACINNNLEIVKYLLTSSELKEHSDIHPLLTHEHYLKNLFRSSRDNFNLIEFLLVDMKVQFNQKTIEYLEENKINNKYYTGNIYEKTLDIISKMKLFHKLDNNLDGIYKNNKKIKI